MSNELSDPISDALRSVRLAGGLFLDSRFTAPWCVAAQIGISECTPFVPGLVQAIGYHVVLEGRMWVVVEGESPVDVRAGEIVLLPRNDTHVMSSGLGLAPIRSVDLIRSASNGLLEIRHGGGNEPTHLVCGFLGTEEKFNPLLAALPRVLKVDIASATSRDWIETSVRFAAQELVRGRLASSSVMSRLSEVLLVEAVRAYTSELGDKAQGWLRGLADARIGRALALIHANLAAPWTADALAREVALSRSVFMERFTGLVGVPPIRYLATWRLNTAKRHLVETPMGVPQVGAAVGYESEEGFRRAFRREFGMSPADWRNRMR
ncbi:MAG: AraC family transcriptional regulator [Rubrivivax sp.]|nr:AraC family transcriptional regulator [Rubrivivax sp.]